MPISDRERWDSRYRERGDALAEPSPFVLSLEDRLPEPGRALDVAGGTGRHAVWLASRGWKVTVADVSPLGLAIARRSAIARGLAVDTCEIDLTVAPLPAGPWDLILCHHFLHRPLFHHFPAALQPGGLLVYVQPTRSNLRQHPRPPAEYLLEDGELPGLVPSLEILSYEEGWFEDGRHEARLVARRPR